MGKRRRRKDFEINSQNYLLLLLEISIKLFYYSIYVIRTRITFLNFSIKSLYFLYYKKQGYRVIGSILSIDSFDSFIYSFTCCTKIFMEKKTKHKYLYPNKHSYKNITDLLFLSQKKFMTSFVLN